MSEKIADFQRLTGIFKIHAVGSGRYTVKIGNGTYAKVNKNNSNSECLKIGTYDIEVKGNLFRPTKKATVDIESNVLTEFFIVSNKYKNILKGLAYLLTIILMSFFVSIQFMSQVFTMWSSVACIILVFLTYLLFKKSSNIKLLCDETVLEERHSVSGKENCKIIPRTDGPFYKTKRLLGTFTLSIAFKKRFIMPKVKKKIEIRSVQDFRGTVPQIIPFSEWKEIVTIGSDQNVKFQILMESGTYRFRVGKKECEFSTPDWRVKPNNHYGFIIDTTKWERILYVVNKLLCYVSIGFLIHSIVIKNFDSSFWWIECLIMFLYSVIFLIRKLHDGYLITVWQLTELENLKRNKVRVFSTRARKWDSEADDVADYAVEFAEEIEQQRKYEVLMRGYDNPDMKSPLFFDIVEKSDEQEMTHSEDLDEVFKKEYDALVKLRYSGTYEQFENAAFTLLKKIPQPKGELKLTYNIFWNLAGANLDLEQYEKARDYYLMGFQCKSGFEDYYLLLTLGHTYYFAGDLEKAKHYYQMLYDVDGKRLFEENGDDLRDVAADLIGVDLELDPDGDDDAWGDEQLYYLIRDSKHEFFLRDYPYSKKTFYLSVIQEKPHILAKKWEPIYLNIGNYFENSRDKKKITKFIIPIGEYDVEFLLRKQIYRYALKVDENQDDNQVVRLHIKDYPGFLILRAFQFLIILILALVIVGNIIGVSNLNTIVAVVFSYLLTMMIQQYIPEKQFVCHTDTTPLVNEGILCIYPRSKHLINGKGVVEYAPLQNPQLVEEYITNIKKQEKSANLPLRIKCYVSIILFVLGNLAAYFLNVKELMPSITVLSLVYYLYQIPRREKYHRNLLLLLYLLVPIIILLPIVTVLIFPLVIMTIFLLSKRNSLSIVVSNKGDYYSPIHYLEGAREVGHRNFTTVELFQNEVVFESANRKIQAYFGAVDTIEQLSETLYIAHFTKARITEFSSNDVFTERDVYWLINLEDTVTGIDITMLEFVRLLKYCLGYDIRKIGKEKK